jgi:photosystem II stability/assembly factor-like uncharacterized protein
MSIFLSLLLLAQAASLRGIHGVDASVIWASGSKGTVLLSTDSGKTWATRDVPDSAALDFRSVYAFSAQRAYVLSSGDKEKSKLFSTTDGGLHWTLLYTSHEGFLDGLKFWDDRHGIMLGDPVDGSFVILTTADAGWTWERRTLPPALPDEGAFAASNSALTTLGDREAWFGTSGARVFHTADRGITWTVAQTPIRHDGKAAGIFSLCFLDPLRGIAVGGDYTKPGENSHNVAVTRDGGLTWFEPKSQPRGYRSAVACLESACVATGPEGSDLSRDAGLSWSPLDAPGYHALSIAGKSVFASGQDGRLSSIIQDR